MQNQFFLMKNLRNQNAVSQLYRTAEDGTTIAYPDITWDVCVIADVLLIVFRGNMSRRERKHIQGLKTAHETYATTAIEALDKDKEQHCWEELSHNLKSIAEYLSEDFEEEVINLIEKHRTYNCSDVELGDLLEKLKCRCSRIASIADKYQGKFR
jgi:tRNA splicing ligase